MAPSPDADRGLHGAAAAAWIEEHAPEAVQDRLFTILENWQVRPDGVAALLWLHLTQALRELGCFDAELSCWDALLGLAPGQPAVQVRRAEVLRLLGQDDQARAALCSVPVGHPSRGGALLALMELEPADSAAWDRAAAEMAALLDRTAEMEPAQLRFARLLSLGGRKTEAAARLADLIRRHPSDDAGTLMELGWVLFNADDPAGARAVFQALWGQRLPEIERLAGRFDGTIPPYTSVIEASIRSRIEAAFAVPEAALARVELGGTIPEGARILYVGFERSAMPNDIAEHFRRSALAAGVDFATDLDDALTFPDQFRGSDAEVSRRVAAFEDRLEAVRPHLVILDAGYMPGQRGLTPQRMRELADRLGFRLVCWMRDALEGCIPFLLAWLPVADHMVLADPGSPILGPEHVRWHGRIGVSMTPAQHLGDGGVPAWEDRDIGLLFVGANTYGVRNMLLSVLMTEDILLTVVTGEQRKTVTPDLDRYAGLLRRSRAVLNVAAHSRSEFLVTGRVFEAIACGAVLIEQDNPSTARFLTPWRHYLPWTHLADIVHLSRFVEDNPEVARRIAVEAKSWLDRHYNSRRMLAELWSEGGNHIP